MVKVDYTGRRYGMLTVESYAGKAADGHSKWRCRCDCGNYATVQSNNLRTGGTISCGCSANKLANARVGQKFGKLTAIRKLYTKGGRAIWEFKCDCGNTFEGDGSHVFTGKVTSCGCDKEKKMERHGWSRTRIYGIWFDMRRRCNQPQNTAFKYYGAKGIKVCEEWERSFIAFKSWAFSHGYSDDLTLDRIDYHKGYSPENCRWADLYTQANNRSNNHLITFEGETLSMADTARKYGISYFNLRARIQKGQEAKQAITELMEVANGND